MSLRVDAGSFAAFSGGGEQLEKTCLTHRYLGFTLASIEVSEVIDVVNPRILRPFELVGSCREGYAMTSPLGKIEIPNAFCDHRMFDCR